MTNTTLYNGTSADKNLTNPRKKSIFYELITNSYSDIFLSEDASLQNSPVKSGILSHVKSRVTSPFQGKFELSFKNEYFFRPIKFEFEPDGRKWSEFESVVEQIFSVVFPILRFMDPINFLDDTVMLTTMFSINAIFNFCLALYHFAKSAICQDRKEMYKGIDNLKQATSNFIIALCMPIVSIAATLADSVRLITRCVATLINFVCSKLHDEQSSSYSQESPHYDAVIYQTL